MAKAVSTDSNERSWSEAGTNVEFDTDGEYLYIRVPIGDDALENGQLSESGKSHILASSKGFIKVNNRVSFGMNVLDKRPGFAYAKKGK